MSLEEHLAANTAALNRLADALAASIVAVQAQPQDATGSAGKPRRQAVAAPKTEALPAPTAGNAVQPAEAAAPAATVQAAESAPQPDAGAKAEPLTYETAVKPVLLKLAQLRGPAVLADLLGGFGVAKGPEVPTAKLPELLTKANELLAA